MRRFIICVAMILGLLAENTRADELREIELTDGSVVTGEVLSLRDGIYSIKSGALGTLRLEESKIRVIRTKSASRGSTGSGTKSLQDRMMGDQEIMAMIPALQNDPDFKKIMEDPEIMKAVADGNIAVLMADPRFMKLLSNPTVQEIQKKIK